MRFIHPYRRRHPERQKTSVHPSQTRQRRTSCQALHRVERSVQTTDSVPLERLGPPHEMHQRQDRRNQQASKRRGSLPTKWKGSDKRSIATNTAQRSDQAQRWRRPTYHWKARTPSKRTGPLKQVRQRQGHATQPRRRAGHRPIGIDVLGRCRAGRGIRKWFSRQVAVPLNSHTG